MKNILKYALFLALAGGLMWYVFKDLPIAELLDTFRQADYQWVILSAGMTLVASWSRAYRWRLLMEPLGYRPSLFNATLAVCMGYFANYIVPRMGEVTRCGALQRTDGVPFEKSFGTVVAERVFDVVTLLVLIALNFALEFDRLRDFFFDFFGSKVSGGNGGSNVLLLTLAATALAGLALAVFLYNRFGERIRQHRLVQKLTQFVSGLVDGLLSIRKLRSPGLFVFHTVLIWTMYYLMAYVLFFSIPETANLGLLAGLTVLVLGSIGMAAPTQGGIGAYHVLVGNVVVLYGLTQKAGITLATFIHGSQMLAVLFFGSLAFLIGLFRQRKGANALEKDLPATYPNGR
jgi:uncharacterized membrane protein YbhN (UPF0104 family)